MAEPRSYHGQPVLKEPTWTWEIPVYFFTGGMAGASAGLAFAAELRGNDELSRRAWLVALGSIGVSPVLLISDLGRPLRFFNMLRVIKPTSPMSIGSWVLTVSGASTAAGAAAAWTPLPIPAARAVKGVAALFGLPLATYTAALIASTAIPVWHEARRELPFVFASGAALSAGGAIAAVTPVRSATWARRLAIGGAVAEIVSEGVMESRLGRHGEPYHSGTPQRFAMASRGLLAAGSAILGTVARRSRPAAVTGGVLVCAGALATRWSVYKAGFVSARDPAAVVGPQRDRIAAGASPGAARSHPRVASTDGQGSPALTVRQVSP